MSVPERAPSTADLPPDLVERAAERLLAAGTQAHARVLDELVRERPTLAAPLRRLADDLAGTERLLNEGYAVPAEQVEHLGPYRVLGMIGEGAFGVVYRCAQDAPVRREAAVKVLRPGVGDRHTLARFEAERHVLARLSHPAIAQVFDAGALPDGRPWFAMEHVRGLPITSWCDRDCLALEARLLLFVRLCQGVHHAHVQGVVHRDLKPANVLVFEQDGQPQPKIIDFGIAKAVYATDREAAFRTETGRVVGTPGYMSPEQSAGGSGDVDARADVFSLGVLLYELLTGELPWGRRPTTTDSAPPRPSARVATDATGDVARRRATPPRKLASRLRGDLDWIVLKALSREPERRYASAQELAADVERHLRSQPVLAGPPALGYRLRKLARRHRIALAAAGVSLLALLLGLWASLSFRAQARSLTADLEAAAMSLLARVNDRKVIHAPQSAALRKALLEEALMFYERFLRGRPADPGLRAGRVRALMMLAQVYWAVGQWAESASVAREAATESEAMLAAEPDNLQHRGNLGNARRNLGRALFDQGQVEAARAELQRAVAELERCHAQAPAEYSHALGRALMEWTTTLRGADPEARAEALRRAVTIHEGAVAALRTPVASLDLLDALTGLGDLLTGLGVLPEAQRTLRRADELLASTPEAGNQYACSVLSAGARLATRRGNHGAAVSRLTRAIEAARRWCDLDSEWSRPWEELYDLHAALAGAHRAAGHAEAAVKVTRTAIAIGDERLARFPGDHMVRGQLSDLLIAFAGERLAHGRRATLAEAEASGRRALQLFETLPDSVDLRVRAHMRWLLLCQLSCVLDACGNADARRHWELAVQALDAWQQRFGVEAHDAEPFAEAFLCAARHHLGAGSDERARTLLDRAEATLRGHPTAGGRGQLHRIEGHRLRALLLARSGQDDRAIEECEQAIATDTWRGEVAAAQGLFAVWNAARAAGVESRPRADGHRDRAIDQHRIVVDRLRAMHTMDRGDPWVALPLGQASVRLAVLLADRGEPDAARLLLDEGLPGLEALRDQVHADRWDEALWLDGKALAER